MFEIIVALIILVIAPMLFHHYVVKRYYNLDKEVFDVDNIGTEGEENV